MSGNGFYLLPTNKIYKKEDSLGSLRTFRQDMLRVFNRIWKTISILAGIFIGEKLQMLTFHEKMSKNVSWPHLTLLKVFRLTLITMSREIEQKMQVLGRN